jgi:hypothetical protein
MSDTFSDREKNFEARWAHDEDLAFKVMARRNKLLGLWAAGEMGLAGPAAEDYARSIVQTDLQHAGHEDVFRKIRADLAAANTARSDHLIRTKMADLLAVAGDQVMHEVKK